MPGVHRLQHVERFFATHFAQDDTVRPHAQAVDQQVALLDLSFAFKIRRTGLHSRHVLLTKLQLGGIFDRHDAFVGGDECREDVEQRRLARARPPGNQDVEARPHAAGEQVHHGLRQRASGHEIVGAKRLLRELANREQRPVHRHRSDHRVDARAVRQARVHHRRGFVDSATGLRDDLLDNALQMSVVLELDRALRELPRALDVHQVGGRHEDVSNVGVLHQRLERAEAEHLVEHLVNEFLFVFLRRREVSFVD